MALRCLVALDWQQSGAQNALFAEEFGGREGVVVVVSVRAGIRGGARRGRWWDRGSAGLQLGAGGKEAGQKQDRNPERTSVRHYVPVYRADVRNLTVSK